MHGFLTESLKLPCRNAVITLRRNLLRGGLWLIHQRLL
jgi:hypothetical protein